MNPPPFFEPPPQNSYIGWICVFSFFFCIFMFLSDVWLHISFEMVWAMCPHSQVAKCTLESHLDIAEFLGGKCTPWSICNP